MKFAILGGQKVGVIVHKEKKFLGFLKVVLVEYTELRTHREWGVPVCETEKIRVEWIRESKLLPTKVIQ